MRLGSWIHAVCSYLAREWLVSILFAALLVFSTLSPRLLWYCIKGAGYGSLGLIASFLLVSRGLIASGAIDNAAASLVEACRGSERRLRILLVLATFILSAFITNDGAVLVVVPLATALSRITRGSIVDYVVPVLLAANTGSFLTPFGNPQNIIIWQHYRVPIHAFLSTSFIPSLIGLSAILVKELALGENITIEPRIPPRIRVDKTLLTVSILLLAIDVVLGEVHGGVYAFVLTLAIIAVIRPYVVKAVDWSILVIFLLMFIDFGFVAKVLESRLHLGLQSVYAYMSGLLLSQVVSNVPATIALLGLVYSWKPLFLAVNIAGYTTPISSLANLIGVRLSGIKWLDYVRGTALFSLAMAFIGFLMVLLPPWC